LGTIIVIGLYTCANVAYVVVLPLEQVQHAPSDRVAAAMLQAIFPAVGAGLMAVAIMISSFGCINGMLMSGARAYFAMARHGLFFRPAAAVNRAHVPGASLAMQGAWAAFLVLIRTYDSSKGTYGNLYSNLLDYVVSAALLFYLLTIAAVFRLRFLRPDAERPYRAFGYPVVPALYLLSAAVILAVLFVYRPATTFPGMVIVLVGVPVYFAFRWSSRKTSQ
jgi:APA family basic amino acid/polyamine antiporter